MRRGAQGGKLTSLPPGLATEKFLSTPPAVPHGAINQGFGLFAAQGFEHIPGGRGVAAESTLFSVGR